MPYWYNVITKEVTCAEDRGPAADLLGPYDTEEQAAQAIELARLRTEAEDAKDRAWNGDEEDPESASGSW